MCSLVDNILHSHIHLRRSHCSSLKQWEQIFSIKLRLKTWCGFFNIVHVKPHSFHACFNKWLIRVDVYLLWSCLLVMNGQKTLDMCCATYKNSFYFDTIDNSVISNGSYKQSKMINNRHFTIEFSFTKIGKVQKQWLFSYQWASKDKELPQT